MSSISPHFLILCKGLLCFFACDVLCVLLHRITFCSLRSLWRYVVGTLPSHSTERPPVDWPPLDLGGALKNRNFWATFYVEKGCFPLQSLNIFGAETGPRKLGNSMETILMAFFRAASSTPTFRIRVCGTSPFRKFPVLKYVKIIDAESNCHCQEVVLLTHMGGRWLEVQRALCAVWTMTILKQLRLLTTNYNKLQLNFGTTRV